MFLTRSSLHLLAQDRGGFEIAGRESNLAAGAGDVFR